MQQVRPCTWFACRYQATNRRITRDGMQWADLCEAHDKTLASEMMSCDIPRIGLAWLQAQGREKL